MKVIILCAGIGSRMGNLTKSKPKCMINFQGKAIIEYQLDLYKRLNINDISIVRGYQGDKLTYSGVKYYENNEGHNMIYSLFKAEPELNGDVIISYGDIIFELAVLDKLISQKEDVCVVSDTNWYSLYSKRFDSQILSDAETFKVDSEKNIVEIGAKASTIEEIEGQFIGLIRLTNKGCQTIRSFYHRNLLENSNKPWLRGRKFDDCYTTDFIQSLINSGINIKACEIHGGWLEFDSITDIEMYDKLIEENKMSGYFRYPFKNS